MRGLFMDSGDWVFAYEGIQTFRKSPQSRVLWVKEGSGKGKTMLLCGIIDELEKESSNQVFYFFCQATKGQLRNPTSVLRSLIWLIRIRQPSLIRNVGAQYDSVGNELFQGINAWVSLVDIPTDILPEPSLGKAIIIIDTLDECLIDRQKLLELIESPSVV
jgi:hypothetical protein